MVLPYHSVVLNIGVRHNILFKLKVHVHSYRSKETMSGKNAHNEGDTHPSPSLPSLSRREDIQSYLTSLAGELGKALDDEQLAMELDSRDQLARFRSQFHLPTVGELTGRAETSGCGLVIII